MADIECDESLFDEALEDYARAIRDMANEKMRDATRIKRGKVAIQAKRFDIGELAFREAASSSRFPDSAFFESQAMLVRLLCLTEQPEESLKEWGVLKTRVGQVVDDVDIPFEVAIAYATIADAIPVRAEEILTHGAGLHFGKNHGVKIAMVRSGLARVLIHKETPTDAELARALKLADAAWRADKSDPGYLKVLADCYRANGKRNAAIAAFGKYQELCDDEKERTLIGKLILQLQEQE